MNVEQSLSVFLDKWVGRWPEWSVASVFVPAAQREATFAWFALRHELAEAAWAGLDPRPGEAKLAWWAEELHGWAQGRRRHPLGIALQRHAAPWASLAASLPSLLSSRDRAADTHEAMAMLEPFAEGVAGISTALFSDTAVPAPSRSVVTGLLAERLLAGGDAVVPLQVLAGLQLDNPPQASARAWAHELLAQWPPPHEGALPGRVHAALVRERLRGFVSGRDPEQALTHWRALLASWRAARS